MDDLDSKEFSDFNINDEAKTAEKLTNHTSKNNIESIDFNKYEIKKCNLNRKLKYSKNNNNPIVNHNSNKKMNESCKNDINKYLSPLVRKKKKELFNIVSAKKLSIPKENALKNEENSKNKNIIQSRNSQINNKRNTKNNFFSMNNSFKDINKISKFNKMKHRNTDIGLFSTGGLNNKFKSRISTLKNQISLKGNINNNKTLKSFKSNISLFNRLKFNKEHSINKISVRKSSDVTVITSKIFERNNKNANDNKLNGTEIIRNSTAKKTAKKPISMNNKSIEKKKKIRQIFLRGFSKEIEDQKFIETVKNDNFISNINIAELKSDSIEKTNNDKTLNDSQDLIPISQNEKIKMEKEKDTLIGSAIFDEFNFNDICIATENTPFQLNEGNEKKGKINKNNEAKINNIKNNGIKKVIKIQNDYNDKKISNKSKK